MKITQPKFKAPAVPKREKFPTGAFRKVPSLVRTAPPSEDPVFVKEWEMPPEGHRRVRIKFTPPPKKWFEVEYRYATPSLYVQLPQDGDNEDAVVFYQLHYPVRDGFTLSLEEV